MLLDSTHTDGMSSCIWSCFEYHEVLMLHIPRGWAIHILFYFCHQFRWLFYTFASIAYFSVSNKVSMTIAGIKMIKLLVSKMSFQGIQLS